jgi:hypothetical protein
VTDRRTATTTVKPTISGPATWPANGPPPRFTVDAAGFPLYMVELAAARHLMQSIVHRTSRNYFYGGDADSVFATGTCWSMPDEVWARLGRLPALYYRVIAFDQASGVSEPSVDDQDLTMLPELVVERWS